MKCLMLIWRPESCRLSHKNHLFYPIVIEYLYLCLIGKNKSLPCLFLEDLMQAKPPLKPFC